MTLSLHFCVIPTQAVGWGSGEKKCVCEVHPHTHLPQLSPAPHPSYRHPVAPLSAPDPSQPLQRGREDCVLQSENKPTLKEKKKSTEFSEHWEKDYKYFSFKKKDKRRVMEL